MTRASVRPAWLTRRLIFVLAILTVLALGGGFFGLARQRALEPLPVLEFHGLDPQVATTLEAAREAVVQAPRSGVAWGRLGMVLLAHDFFADARACLKRAEELDPDDPRWPYLQGTILRWTNPDSLTKLRRTIELCGMRPIAPSLHLGEALLMQGALDEAETEFKQLEEFDPANPWVQRGLARVARERGDWQAVLDRLRPPSVRDLLPRSYHGLRAECFQRLGQPDAASPEQQQARSQPPDPDAPDPYSEEVELLRVGEVARTKLAGDYLRQGRLPEALKLLAEVSTSYPDSSVAWALLGRARMQARDLRGAEAALRKALALEPASADTELFLGLVQFDQGQPADAQEHFQHVLKMRPDSSMAHYMLGRCAEKAGNPAQALTSYRAATHYAPHLAAAHLALGELLARQGSRAEALQALRHALRLEPQNAQARKALERCEASSRAR